MIEAVADASGCWIPSVPVISVVPLVPDDTWRITAVLLSPTASAFAASQYAGAGLNMTSIKLSAKQISQIPLPSDQAAWTEGARLVASAHSAVSASERVDRLLEFGAIMCTAYRQEAGDLMSWWTDRAKLLGGTGEAA